MDATFKAAMYKRLSGTSSGRLPISPPSRTTR